MKKLKYMAKVNTGDVIRADSMRQLYDSLRSFFRTQGASKGAYYAAIEINDALHFFVWFAEGKLVTVPIIPA